MEMENKKKESKKSLSLREGLNSVRTSTEAPRTENSGLDILLGGKSEEVVKTPHLPSFAPDIRKQAELHKERMKRRGRPRKSEEEVRRQSEIFIIKTFKVKREFVEKINTISYLDGKQLQDVLNSIIETGINAYETEHGKIEQVIRNNK